MKREYVAKYYFKNLLCACSDQNFLYIRTSNNVQKMNIMTCKITKKWEIYIDKSNDFLEYIYLKNGYLYVNTPTCISTFKI